MLEGRSGAKVNRMVSGFLNKDMSPLCLLLASDGEEVNEHLAAGQY